MSISQEELNAKADAATEKYMAMDENEAAIDLTYSIQGWVASRVLRGHTLHSSLNKITDLLLLIDTAQEEGDDSTISVYVRNYPRGKPV
jgi:hypothetical protein